MLKETPLDEYLQSIHAEFKSLTDGALADYIPELTKADPEWFGIVLVKVEGHVYQVGDTRETFTIQSSSKPFAFGIALEDNGVEAMRRCVNVEPSGEAFNRISLEHATGRPRNAMINAGAIATTGQIHGKTADEKLQRLLNAIGRYTGHPMSIDEAVYRSEKATGHRNRAISHLLLTHGTLKGDPEESLDLYFKQCSIQVNCRDLAIMAATLANQGVNPITGVRALRAEYVPKVLSVMSSCGMYDGSGGWTYDVGMPAKSGVGGGILAVLPGRLGIGVFSPKLDVFGNSARGVKVCEKLSVDLGLHMFRSDRLDIGSVVRGTYDLTTKRSKRTRDPEATQALSELGKRVKVYDLVGELSFVSAEIVMFEIVQKTQDIEYCVINMLRVSSVDAAAIQLIAGIVASLAKKGVKVALVGTQNQHGLSKRFDRAIGKQQDMSIQYFQDIDESLEWCEEQLLGREKFVRDASHSVPFKRQPLLAGLSGAELDRLGHFVASRTYQPKETLCKEGDTDRQLYFLEQGEVSVRIPIDAKRTRRVATFCAGATFGELAVIDTHPRSARVVADTAVNCCVLDFAALEACDSSESRAIVQKIIVNLARDLSRRLRSADHEIAALSL